MKTLNRVTLMGNIVSDVDHKKTKNGVSRAYFPLATNRNVKSDDGSFKESTDYHNIVSWGALADISGKHLKKGSSIYLEGKLVNNNFETPSGEKRYRSEIFADKIHFLRLKGSSKISNENENKETDANDEADANGEEIEKDDAE